ncbi:hypothetical protein KY290_030740 [Solanum tuberosum]|uniref:F-box domain-containing protein n=1 Tax=Solanum tuberosum TaxID=4113 RepID=A0ABQ7U751_SOLTU|nr:hypothetical protein KY290_030740 [Solanum tuberosum]
MDVDVATEIMSGLPVRSLLRFKCVSKLWMTLISDPYFSKKHLNHARNDVQQIERVQKLDFPCNDKPWRYSLYCCCNGMALMGFCNYPDKHFQLLLWNPSTRESIVLPDPKILPKDYCTWELGYDSASDDYKILKIDDKSCSEILALKSGSWRLLDKHPIDAHPMLKSTGSLVCVHGAFHWLIRSLTKYYVMSFSITDDVYREIPFPEQLYSNCLLGRGVSELGGMLCVYSGHPKDRLDYGLNLMSFRMDLFTQKV